MDTQVSTTVPGMRWLVLLPQLPPKPDYLRVKLQRRLQRLGAISLKNGVYALPDHAQTVEDCEWLRRELAADGADLLVCASTLMTGMTDAELRDRFRAASEVEFRAIAREARDALAHEDGEARSAELVRLRKVLAQAVRVDFFDAAGRDDATRSLASLEHRKTELPRSSAVARAAAITPGRTWVTRSGVFVDRIASAWLIRRFIDRRAKFKFVDGGKGYRPASNEVRFDMYQAEYTHVGDRCTFETLLDSFGLDEPALVAIAEIVHDLDCQDDKYQRPETFGIGAVLTGIRQSEPRDDKRLALGWSLFDGLYAQLVGAETKP